MNVHLRARWYRLTRPVRRARAELWRRRHPDRAAEVARRAAEWERATREAAERYAARASIVTPEEWRDAIDRDR